MSSPAHQPAIDDLTQLLVLSPPPFIYITDPLNAPLLASSLAAFFEEKKKDYAYAHVSGVACFNKRVLFDNVVNGLAGWEPKWEDGGRNWISGIEDGEEADGVRWNEDWGAFIHGVQAVHNANVKGKGKGKEKNTMVVLIDTVEKLDADWLLPLTRLRELSRTNVTVIFTSCVDWQSIRVDFGDAKDPYYIDVAPPTKETTTSYITSQYTHLSSTSPHTHPPSLTHFFTHYATTVVNICFSCTTDLKQLCYIAMAVWPRLLAELQNEHDEMEEEDEERRIVPPDEVTRMKLMRTYAGHITSALETLLPRLYSSATFSSCSSITPSHDRPQSQHLPPLPLLSKFILIAAFLASTNPPKVDLRMFGRTKEGVMGRKKKGGGTRKVARPKEGAKIPIPQRHLGPTTFSLDRLIGILGALMSEYWPAEDGIWEEYSTRTERRRGVEERRVGVYQAITTLTTSHLLQRIAPPDRIDDASSTYKVGRGVTYEAVLELARGKDVGVSLGDFLWESWN
ncbi:origin recognition complex subunit 5 C-terminus-domain-containing protein [Pterulicium gracile]|uniref:Origin recognition complex subunit 5 C-terminus-domain-containing protein n=1 Tax=Pterulicium gracile TaxID=1884261 RepID=A0A5C3QCE5_9AGAR|nr:origin recognition complex subunit 5 C-terminus-domain-containing protein [Pterula gracilis]